jgi:plasmid stabilization system protein ParE
MELELYWTDFSKKELKNIFNYYKEKASLNVAKTLVIGITTAVKKLKKQPTIGQEEELLKNDSRNFRYLISTNFKIIYWINLEKNRIEIFDVFDTRQSPKKMKRTT